MENDRHALRQRNQYQKNDPYLIIPIKHFYVSHCAANKKTQLPICGQLRLCFALLIRIQLFQVLL